MPGGFSKVGGSSHRLIGISFPHILARGHLMRLDNYSTDGFYDEMFDLGGRPRGGAEALAKRLALLSDGELVRRPT